jgi:hypothetical protein
MVWNVCFVPIADIRKTNIRAGSHLKSPCSLLRSTCDIVLVRGCPDNLVKVHDIEFDREA